MADVMDALILWTHALAALLFSGLALGQARKPGGGVPGVPLVAALALTALWLLAAAGIGFADLATRLADAARAIGWLVFTFALARTVRGGMPARTVVGLYLVVGAVMLGAAALGFAGELWRDPALHATIARAALALKAMATLGALLLVRELHARVDARSPGGVRLAVLALAAMGGVELVLALATWLSGRWPAGLVAARGFALIALVPVWSLAARRRDGVLQVSRTVAFQSLTVVAVGLYVAVTGFATALIGEFAGEGARVAQTALVFGSAATLLTIGSTPWLRAWAKVIVAKHLFAHRYDYRAEWLRFTGTLGTPGGDAALAERVVKAIADLTDSPGGVLLVPDGDGLGLAATWTWDQPAELGDTARLAAYLTATRRIVELDTVRGGRGEPGEAAAVPAGLIASADAWAIVPLLHGDALAGAIVLARPPIDRALDWEDFDLLGVAGRQAASYLAEDRARTALADAERFDEFNRRFAFILHDLKNLVSQLTLVARNAQRHADNPEFRADMVATLKDSSDRMTALLARLSQHGPRQAAALGDVAVAPLLARLALTQRAQHPVEVIADAALAVRAEPGALETLLGHLLQNATEASVPSAPVTLAATPLGDVIAIDVIDRGQGMSPAFVRERLFKPFDSSKPGGFGIGAFEAKQLVEAMGGSIAVDTREGEGTRFRVLLPSTTTQRLDHAA
jgi:putative PEP-CTERM system histidine kinase